jgi:putative membrane protein
MAVLRRRRNKPELWKGLVSGISGGLVASWTMNQFQAGLSKAGEALQNRGEEQHRRKQSQAESEDATMKAAEKLSHAVLDRGLTKREKKKAGPLIHYAFGTLMGGVYGAAGEYSPVVKSAFGLPFGTALFLGADEIAVPALGLSKGPTQHPLSTHASALAAHLIYGGTTEAVRRGLRKVL